MDLPKCWSCLVTSIQILGDVAIHGCASHLKKWRTSHMCIVCTDNFYNRLFLRDWIVGTATDCSICFFNHTSSGMHIQVPKASKRYWSCAFSRRKPIPTTVAPTWAVATNAPTAWKISWTMAMGPYITTSPGSWTAKGEILCHLTVTMTKRVNDMGEEPGSIQVWSHRRYHLRVHSSMYTTYRFDSLYAIIQT